MVGWVVMVCGVVVRCGGVLVGGFWDGWAGGWWRTVLVGGELGVGG